MASFCMGFAVLPNPLLLTRLKLTLAFLENTDPALVAELVFGVSKLFIVPYKNSTSVILCALTLTLGPNITFGTLLF